MLLVLAPALHSHVLNFSFSPEVLSLWALARTLPPFASAQLPIGLLATGQGRSRALSKRHLHGWLGFARGLTALHPSQQSRRPPQLTGGVWRTGGRRAVLSLLCSHIFTGGIFHSCATSSCLERTSSCSRLSSSFCPKLLFHARCTSPVFCPLRWPRFRLEQILPSVSIQRRILEAVFHVLLLLVLFFLLLLKPVPVSSNTSVADFTVSPFFFPGHASIICQIIVQSMSSGFSFLICMSNVIPKFLARRCSSQGACAARAPKSRLHLFHLVYRQRAVIQHFNVVTLQFVLWMHVTNPVIERLLSHASPSDISAPCLWRKNLFRLFLHFVRQVVVCHTCSQS